MSWDPGLGATEHSGVHKAGHTDSPGTENTPGLGRGPAGTTGRCHPPRRPCSGSRTPGRRACLAGSPDSHLPRCPAGMLARPRCLSHALQNLRPCHCPVSTPGATPKVGGQDPLSPANKGTESAGAHGPTWEASRMQRFRGQGLGQDSGTRPCAPGGSGIQQRHQTTGREGRAGAQVHSHAFSCIHGHAHAWTLTQAH